jgi:hypothetical protein
MKRLPVVAACLQSHDRRKKEIAVYKDNRNIAMDNHIQNEHAETFKR